MFQSGPAVFRDSAGDREAMDRLVGGLERVLDYAEAKRVPLAFEPEPGMFIDTLKRHGELLDALESRGVGAERLKLTIDVGHLHCQGELPIAEKLRQWSGHLVNVHLDDMRAGVHEHLMFGEGEIDFPPVIAALAEIRYSGIISVELTRHAHLGPQAARQAYNFLRRSASGRSGRAKLRLSLRQTVFQARREPRIPDPAKRGNILDAITSHPALDSRPPRDRSVVNAQLSRLACGGGYASLVPSFPA